MSDLKQGLHKIGRQDCISVIERDMVMLPHKRPPAVSGLLSLILVYIIYHSRICVLFILYWQSLRFYCLFLSVYRATCFKALRE